MKRPLIDRPAGLLGSRSLEPLGFPEHATVPRAFVNGKAVKATPATGVYEEKNSMVLAGFKGLQALALRIRRERRT
jgi:hypothetical protein